MRVCLDGGHGYNIFGRPTGARSKWLVEDDVVFSTDAKNLGIVQRVGHILRKNGINTVLSRSDKKLISLKSRVIKASGCDAFISFHCNSAKTPGHGFEIIVDNISYKSMQLAEVVENKMKVKLGGKLPSRGVKTDNNTPRKHLYVLEKSGVSRPSILIECGFLNNKVDSKLLSEPVSRQIISEAIASGIIQYLK